MKLDKAMNIITSALDGLEIENEEEINQIAKAEATLMKAVRLLNTLGINSINKFEEEK